MPEWVSNASPLIVLCAIERLDLIGVLGGRIQVPAAVLEEVRAGPSGSAITEAILARPEVAAVPDRPIAPTVVAWDLDPGESQVITHALEGVGTGVLLDDLMARRAAQSLGLPLIGTIGLVARATRAGVLASAAPTLQAVRDAGLYLTDRLVLEVLEELGEG